MSHLNDSFSDIPKWLGDFNDNARKDRVWSLGLITGWRRYPDGSYGAPNFERALILDRLIEILNPKEFLEIGTGRGLGVFAVKAAAREYKCDVRVTTIDALGPDTRQSWPIQLGGDNKVITSSRDEVWGKYIDKELRSDVRQITGWSTKALPRLASHGNKYDLVFIDGGHDIDAVIHDLAYSLTMLKPGGAILMDDIAPLEDYGFGSCVATFVARKFIENISVFPTEGLVYGGAVNPYYPRGMALLWGEKHFDQAKISRLKLVFWKLLGSMLWFGMQAKSFPLK